MRKINLGDFRAAGRGIARDINRRIVLNLVRTRQPISRADIARLTGLQRSTVSLIVDQLIGEEWIIEGALGSLPRGRRPTHLHLNNERARIGGINVRPGGTNIAIADLTGRIIAQETIPTLADPEVFVPELCRRTRQFMKGHANIACEGIGVSVPGRVDDKTQRLVFAPNLGWKDVDIRKPLEKATGMAVSVENAANACALAETWFGKEAASATSLIAVTVAEGIGTGIMIGGQLVRGLGGRAGEFGHVSLDENGPLCRCGNRGCWETFASNAAAVSHFKKAIVGTSLSKSEFSGSGGEPTIQDILRLAADGNAKACETLQRMAHFLGSGIALLVSGLAPEMVVVVGEITRSWDQVYPIIDQVVSDRCSASQVIGRIVPADESTQPRLRGTFALILQKHFGAPMIA